MWLEIDYPFPNLNSAAVGVWEWISLHTLLCLWLLIIHVGILVFIDIYDIYIYILDTKQAITWTNAALLLIRPLGTNFSENLINIQNVSLIEMHLNMSYAKWRPFCPGRD